MNYKINTNILIILAVACFVIVTIVSGNLGGMSDGVSRFGFPFVFYQETGGKCADCSTLNWFRWPMLFMDIAIAVTVSFVLTTVYRYLKRG
jgi:hypothetical protein